MIESPFVSTPGVFALEVISTDPAAAGAVVVTPTVPEELVSALAIVAVPLTVAVPAYCTVPAMPADPTVAAVVVQMAVPAPLADARTEPAAPGAVAPVTFTVPVASTRALATVAVPAKVDTVAVPANVETVAVPALVAKVATVAVPALVAKVARVAVPAYWTVPACVANATLPRVADHTAVLLVLETRTDPAPPGGLAPNALTLPVLSARDSATVAVPLPPPPPPVTTVAVWIALPVGIRPPASR